MPLTWRVPNPLCANPLVAERAFPTSDYWGRTGVARCASEMRQESVGISNSGQETKHVKIGHVKIDRAHFRVHFCEHWKISRDHWKISREHSRGSLRGDPLVRFTQTKPQPSWAFPWTSSCTLPCSFSWALSWESSWVKFRGSRALCFSEKLFC